MGDVQNDLMDASSQESIVLMSTEDLTPAMGIPDSAARLLTTGTHISGDEHVGHTPSDVMTPTLSFDDLTTLPDAPSSVPFDSAESMDGEGMKQSPAGPRRRSLLPMVLVAEVYPPDISAGLNEIAQHAVHKNFMTEDNMNQIEDAERVPVHFRCDEQLQDGAVFVRPSHAHHCQIPEGEKFVIHVTYKRTCEAFRAVGRMMGVLFDLFGPDELAMRMSWEECAQFESLGVMLDCSRCAVLSVETVLYMLRTCALLGMNTFQLYTEDTFTVPDEPFFGYLRGQFSQEEMTYIDTYAASFGIEVFPCIQTLGHLGQILQWPRFAGVRDTTEVILAGSEETYQLIEKIIDAASAPLKSKRIHIGMDEAHGVGEGRYRQIFGDKDSSEVFLAHLQRVEKICKDRGLQPMVWSDMLFTLAAKNSSLQSYYETSDLPQEMKHNMPEDLNLVYWDYYHTNVDAYLRKIQQHRDLGFEPWVAGGICALPFTIAASDACLKACKRGKVKNVFVTTWGDDGNECDIMSALPGFVYYAEHCYTSEPDVDWNLLRNNFAGICGGNLDDWIYASKIDVPLESMDKTRFPPNVSKWILWNDPFYGFLSPQYQNMNLEAHYEQIATYLRAATSEETVSLYPLNGRLTFPALIAETLTIKCGLRDRLVAAYKSDDPNRQLFELARGTVQNLRQSVDTLWRYHRDRIWLSTYKPFGMEVVELRYGAIRTRLETLQDRILAFCEIDGDVSPSRFTAGIRTAHREELPELDVELREVYTGIGLEIVVDFARAYTPSRALGTG
ncbi:beta-N-acetylhexosaminidase [Powellomyces hirtus]|uniref:beta-N-acetylhexosaminidase n=1 Tax=Powellomyces hirtus TaxID=109895 RepID=A0A507DU14_9FUNG|nr:beta-N-acetylhexosaminidase [Powellomyces hirtus]